MDEGQEGLKKRTGTEQRGHLVTSWLQEAETCEINGDLPAIKEKERESGILPHRDPLEGICLLPIRAAWKLSGFTDEIWTMARKVGTRGSCRLNEAISQIIRLEDMLIFLP